MRLEDMKSDIPETPDFIHKMIQNEVAKQIPVSYTHLPQKVFCPSVSPPAFQDMAEILRLEP